MSFDPISANLQKMLLDKRGANHPGNCPANPVAVRLRDTYWGTTNPFVDSFYDYRNGDDLANKCWQTWPGSPMFVSNAAVMGSYSPLISHTGPGAICSCQFGIQSYPTSDGTSYYYGANVRVVIDGNTFVSGTLQGRGTNGQHQNAFLGLIGGIYGGMMAFPIYYNDSLSIEYQITSRSVSNGANHLIGKAFYYSLR